MSHPAITGVLFDIDDTLVDLATAARDAFEALSAGHLARSTAEARAAAAEGFVGDRWGHYERYMAGELTFTGQRIARLRRAYSEAGGPELDDGQAEAWSAAYEEAVRGAWAPFADAHPCLDALDALGVPYGAVSNNIAEYQRRKLEAAGLERVAHVVGSDTAGAPKPDPAPFLEGARLLGSDPARTLYVGDNPVNDVEGARAAGLPAVLLDRTREPVPAGDVAASLRAGEPGVAADLSAVAAAVAALAGGRGTPHPAGFEIREGSV